MSTAVMERMTQHDRAWSCSPRPGRWATAVLAAILPLAAGAQATSQGSNGQGSSAGGHAASGPATVQAAQQTLQSIPAAGSLRVA